MSADRIAPEVHELLELTRADGRFSAAAWAVGSSAGAQSGGVVGTFARDDARPIGPDALFDLASITKPVVALALLRLVDRGELSLRTTVGEVLEEWPEGPMVHADLRSLLTHTSGARARRRYGAITRTGTPCCTRSGSSDSPSPAPGAIPRWASSRSGSSRSARRGWHWTGSWTGRSPARSGCARRRTDPVDPERAVATEICPWRGHLVRGTVHDENAVVLGGIAGHAGLFGTADDLGRLGTALLRGELFSSDMDRDVRGAEDGRPLGWWPREQCTYLGEEYSAEAFGHTGFTGTSLVLDPAADRWAVLLTNRVHPSREARGLELVRAGFHRAVAGLPA